VLRSIHADLRQLEGEVGKINDVVFLEKGAFDDTDIAAMRDNPSGTTLYVEVRADNAMGESPASPTRVARWSVTAPSTKS
jgi:hypothetical protein